MNAQHLHMNAAAIDRFHLVERVRATQRARGESVAARFDRFARSQGGALYEHDSAQAIERAFARFEWAEIDRIYTDVFSRFANGPAAGSTAGHSQSREVRMIVAGKLRRLVKDLAGVTFLAVVFISVSTLTGEAILHFMR